MIDRLDLQNRNWPVEVFENWRRSGLLVLDMPYQRGEVWGTKRRRNFILSLLRGIPTPSIVVNDRLRADFTDEGRNGYAIVDGKQRVTTILAFLDDKLSVPREWFDDGASREPLVVFSQLAIAVQRRFKGRPLATAETLVKTLAEEKTLFDMINYGGLAQGEIDSDISEHAEPDAEPVSPDRLRYQKLKILCADKAEKITSMIEADDFEVARLTANEIAGDLERLRDCANHLADTE